MLENPVFDSETTLSDEQLASRLSRRSILTLGAIAGAVLVLPSLPARASVGYGDATSLRFLEEVQRLQHDFFVKAALSTTTDKMKEHEVNVINLIAQQDGEQLRWFVAARQAKNINTYGNFYSPTLSSSRPDSTYTFDFGKLSTRADLFDFALKIKQTAVSAYHGIVGEGGSASMVEAFASLAGVQGRHLAMLSDIAGKTPVVAYESALSRKAVASKFSGYGFNREVLG